MENHQNSPFDCPSQVFRGIRFVLLGFDPVNKVKVSRKLVDGGGVDAGQYGPNCTHVIVNKLVYDDPICVAARRDEKILVSGIWAEHCIELGVPVDPTSVMYRPVRDLNGIPGAKSLVICLTGYQHDDREDIMTMVDLMGAKFSKPLIANKVTHLICYRFEGEKYLLAKKMKKIKLINHRWLEDCLKAWEIVSEADYSRSGYELETEVEAKDSEDEAVGGATRLNEVKKESPSPHHSLITKQDVSTSLPNASASRVFENADDIVSVTMKTTSDQFLNPHKNDSGSVAKRSPLSQARKVISSICSRKVTMETTPPALYTESNMNSAKKAEKVNLSDAFNMSSPLVEKEEQNASSSSKRKIDTLCGSSKLQKMSHNEDMFNRESLHVESGFQELKEVPPAETSDHMSPKTDISNKNGRDAISPPQNPPSNSTERILLSSKGKSVTCDEPISKFSTPEILQDKDRDAELKETSLATKFGSRDVGMVEIQGGQKLEHVMQSLEKSSPSVVTFNLEKSSTSNLEVNELSGGSSSKFARKKSIAKKFSAPKQNLSKKKTANLKGSIYLQNREPQNETVDVEGVGEQVTPVAKSGTEMDGVFQIENMSENKTLGMDDETEPPEDKEEAGKDKHEDGGEPGRTDDILMEENAHGVNQDNEKDEDIAEAGNKMSMNDEVLVDKSDETEKHVSGKTSRGKKAVLTAKAKKKIALSVKDVTDKKAAKKKEVPSEDNNEKPEVREEVATPLRASKRTKKNVNDLEKSAEVQTAEGVSNNVEHKNDDDRSEHVFSASEKDEVEDGKSDDTENVINKKATKRSERPPMSKTKKDVAPSVKKGPNTKTVNKKGKPTSSLGVKACDMEAQKENMQIPVDDQNQSAGNKQSGNEKVIHKSKKAVNSDSKTVKSISKDEPMWFILSGHKLQRREFQQIIRKLKGKICRVSHQWSYQATHFIVPDPIRRTEKFFAAAASGSWILKTDYLSASNEAGRFLAEEPYEWHKNGLSEDGQINLEAPRKWRLLKEKTGHGAFYGMRIVIYGECIAPTLDTIKRAVKAGDGSIVATSPPYTRFLNTGIDFAIVSPGMPHVDIWVQEFLRHEIPCVSADYLVEYVCKPGYPLERHVQYDTNVWAERSFNNLQNRLKEEITSEPTTPDSNDVACEVCGSRDRGEEMMICGNESGSVGCGVGMHIDCCDPPFEDVPEEDWFCPKCSKPNKTTAASSKKTSKRKGK